MSRCFFFNDTATTEIYTLSLHDALPIFAAENLPDASLLDNGVRLGAKSYRSEEHTSELQSRGHLVCRLLLEKKKNCRRMIQDKKKVRPLAGGRLSRWLF